MCTFFQVLGKNSFSYFLGVYNFVSGIPELLKRSYTNLEEELFQTDTKGMKTIKIMDTNAEAAETQANLQVILLLDPVMSVISVKRLLLLKMMKIPPCLLPMRQLF